MEGLFFGGKDTDVGNVFVVPEVLEYLYLFCSRSALIHCRPLSQPSVSFLTDREQPLNWNVRPKSPEGRTAYEGAPGIKPTRRNETKCDDTT